VRAIDPKFGFGRDAFRLTVWPSAVRVTPAANGTVTSEPSGKTYVRV
jgi:hypothetical protein